MSWVGKLEGQPLSDVVLVVYDGILSGSVVWPDDAYRIRFDGTGSVVEQLDDSQFPEDNCFEEVPAGLAEVSAESATAADDGSLVDVLVVYTPAARAAAGGASGMLSLINLAVSETNTGYANSGVVQRLRLVGTSELSYTESDISTDLSRVTGTSDGYMDSVHTLRNTSKADEVVLIGEGYAAAGACGVAWLMSGNNPGFATNAFAVVERSCATGYYSFGHELGHNMGLNHARVDPIGTGAYSYSYGYKDPGNAFRTVMAYNCPVNCTRILHFSNPNVTYGGRVTGISEASPSSAYNALSLNNTRVTVANWRVASTPQVAVVTPNGGETWVAGSVRTISWTSANLNASATIKLTYTNGTSTDTIVSGLARTATSYDWTVPSALGPNWRVTACSDVGGVCEAQDSSDATFTIVAPPSVAMMSPNGGESWPVGSIQAISWTAANLSPSATIKLSYTNGTTTNPIVSGLARTTTSYNWTVPDNQASNWKVTVCSDVGGSCEAQDSSDASFSITAPASPPARHDLNGDGKPDLLWHHQKTGALYAWLMNGTAQSSGTYLTPASVNPVWQVRGVGNLNGDGTNDVLWHHQTTGALYAWLMNGTAQSSGTYLTPGSVNLVWQVQGLADLNGDGKLDILWRHRSTGQLYAWMMSGFAESSGTFLTPSAVASAAWQIRGLADFNADGQADILWHHQTTGQAYVWFMNGTTQSSGAFLTPSAVANTAWKVVQVDDFNADGKPDVLWRNRSTGALYLWFMNGTAQASGAFLTPAAVANPAWQITPQ
jgi:hypothetical protein